MNARTLLTAALAVAALVAACGGEEDDSTSLAANARKKKGAAKSSDTLVPDNGTTAPVATLSPDGKAFYKSDVHPILQQVCGSCHATGPGPAWFTPNDSEKSYAQLFAQGFVSQQSRLLTKGPHGTSSTNVLNAQQAATFSKWVSMELKDGGEKASPNILEKLGSCFDKAKFDAMKMGDWRTTRRNNDNNVNKVNPWNENANECIGCDNTECSSCHSSDPGSTFNDAEGNDVFPPGTTFENTKLNAPPYITKFFGVSPDGKPIASDGIQKKSDSTRLVKAYQHPMFVLTDEQKGALNTFVQDAITKYNAGICGK